MRHGGNRVERIVTIPQGRMAKLWAAVYPLGLGGEE